jgi:competence protein ComEA
VDINTAPAEDLEKIPYIGETLEKRIVQHRNDNGPFRRVEHLMLVAGISDKRFRKIRPFVRVE